MERARFIGPGHYDIKPTKTPNQFMIDLGITSKKDFRHIKRRQLSGKPLELRLEFTNTPRVKIKVRLIHVELNKSNYLDGRGRPIYLATALVATSDVDSIYLKDSPLSFKHAAKIIVGSMDFHQGYLNKRAKKLRTITVSGVWYDDQIMNP